MIKKCGGLVVIFFVLFYALSFTSYAMDKTPTGSFTHWDLSNGAKRVVPMREVYKPATVLNVRNMGIENGFEKIADIDTDNKGNLYILTTDSCLFAVDRQYSLLKEYEIVDAAGEQVDFTGAQGIYVPNANEIYIADTANRRVLCCDGNGKVLREIVQPDASVIQEDFIFAPVKVEKDSKNFLYVLSDGSYYGALLFDPKGEFSGFYGANTVRGSALTVLSYLWDALTKNDIKRAGAVKVLPYQFLDIYIDNNDFVYTCTGRTTSGASTGQIKMLSPGGTNILYKQQYNGVRVSANGFNFGESTYVRRNNQTVVQNFTEIQVDENGFIYALDSTYGLIYVYDSDCNLITAFGGGKTGGNQAGVFSEATSMVYDDSRLMVADSMLNTITVFELTEFGRILLSAQKKTLNADYTGATEEWQEVLKLDAYSRLAYRGLAKSAYNAGDYQKALQYAKEGYDFVTYGQALEKIEGEFIDNNFAWLFLLAVAAIGLIAAFLVITVKRKVTIIRNEKVRVLFNGLVHPFETFNSIKFKNKGSVVIAVVLAILFYLSTVVKENYSNFRFTTFNPETSSSLFLMIRSLGLIALWVIANWAVCVLQEGKGRLKEIFIVSAYSTWPLVAANLIETVLTHFIVSPNSTLLSGLSAFAVILTGIMLTIGMMVIHEYSFPKFLGSVALTLFAMILIVFILFMIGMLLSQLWMFIANLFMEVIYR